MSEGKTSIHMTWNEKGQLSHHITGATLPSPRDDPKLWILAPSAPFYLCHQLSVLEPPNGLEVCRQITDLLSGKRYVRTPINATLKSARIDLIYLGSGSAGVQFFPKHALIHNSANLEEGQRQLVTNYFHYIYDRFSEYHQLPIRTATCAVIGAYYIFLSEIIESGLIGPDNVRWNREFSRWGAISVRMVSEKYFVPDHEDKSWALKQAKHLNDVMKDLKKRHKMLSKQLELV